MISACFLLAFVSVSLPISLYAAATADSAQIMDISVSRIYVDAISYHPEGLIEVEINIFAQDSALKPLRRAMIGIASDRPDKDLFYTLDGEPTNWQRTDYEGKVSFLMRTSVEGAIRVGATVNEDQILWRLNDYLYGYNPDSKAANIVSGKALEFALNRNDALKNENLSPHEQEQIRSFYGASNITFFLNSDIMFCDGEMKRLDAIPVLKNDVTFLPLRVTAEALGAAVSWDVNLNETILTRGLETLHIKAGSVEIVKFIMDNPHPIIIPINAPAYLDETSGRMMVPLRAVSSAFNAVVWYDAQTRSVHLTQQRGDNYGFGESPL